MNAVHAALPPHARSRSWTWCRDYGIKLTPKHYAYLKISEGCNHRCSFCIIPSMRGDLVSRPVDEVLREAEKLVRGGVQGTAGGVAGHQRLRRRREVRRARLARQVVPDPHEGACAKACPSSASWTRLHYVYPYPHVDDIIPLMAEGKLLPYLDIPFQHASPRILKLMKRPGAVDKTLERIQRWRAICPDITIRSTFIVGFPGETEAEFEELLDFLDEAELDRVGAFAYSPVDGAKANDLPDPVPEEVKQERLARFMELQAEISAEKLAAQGRQRADACWSMHIDGELAIGRSMADAPEIDGLVQIQDGAAAGLKPGEFVDVTHHGQRRARPVRPRGPRSLTWRTRRPASPKAPQSARPRRSRACASAVGALRNLPPFLRQIWDTSPGLTLASLGLRLVRALLPVIMLYIGKLIIDEALRLVGLQTGMTSLRAWCDSGLLNRRCWSCWRWSSRWRCCPTCWAASSR